MATFKNATKKDHQVTSLTQGGTSLIYTAPPKGSIIIGASLANTDGSDNDNNYTLAVYDSSEAQFVMVVEEAAVPDGTSLVAVNANQKIVLDDSDEVHVITGAASESVDVLLSLWEEVN